MNTLEKISKMLFSHLLQFTGANMVIMNITEKLNHLDMYDAINDVTPVIFTCMISPTTALVGCLHDDKARLLAKKCNNCVLVDQTNTKGDLKALPRIRCMFIETKQRQRQKCFNWGTKTSDYNYYNYAMNVTLSLSKIIEFSSMMKEKNIINN